ncbi:hypothetical protein HHX47_DHR7000704 [Lentinula edodes]|nr:hypothetical protein HHX47_DHR7000704 [Lentinula edodes]
MLFISVSVNLIPRCRYRPFSASARWLDHYKTLGVNTQASKAQIKSQFYLLSKKHHPDISQDPESKEIYAAVSAAYSVLSNDRERRAYDKKMQQNHRSFSSHSPHLHPAANHNGEWSRRHPGATHAWARRSYQHPHEQKSNSAGPSNSSASGFAQQGFRGFTPHSGRSTFMDSSSIHANAATDGDKSMFRRRMESVHRDREKIEKVSGSVRAFQVLLVLVLISAVAAPSMRPSNMSTTQSLPVNRLRARKRHLSDEELDLKHGSDSTISSSLSDEIK